MIGSQDVTPTLRFTERTKPVAEGLLQARLNGTLNRPKDVVPCIQQHQPKDGLTNDEWLDICAFIEGLEKGNTGLGAMEIAGRYGLKIRYKGMPK